MLGIVLIRIYVEHGICMHGALVGVSSTIIVFEIPRYACLSVKVCMYACMSTLYAYMVYTDTFYLDAEASCHDSSCMCPLSLYMHYNACMYVCMCVGIHDPCMHAKTMYIHAWRNKRLSNLTIHTCVPCMLL